MFGLFTKAEKPLYRCKMMERINCDLDSALSNPKPRSDEHCEIVAETDKYLFYRYNAYEDNSGGYIVRREKGRPSRMVFFGNNTRMVCFFKGYLFQCNHVGPREEIGIFAKQINTGKTIRFDWLGQGELRVWRLPDVIDSYVQDTINDMTVEGDELVFNITRLRSEEKGLDDRCNIDMDYVLRVSFTGGKFVPKAYYSLENYNTLYSEKVSSRWMPRLAFKDPREWKTRDAESNKTNIAERIPISQNRRIPVQATVPFRCDHCGKVFYIQVDNDDSRAGQIIERYKRILPGFKDFGYTATMHCYCDDCAKRFVPEFGGTLKTLTVTVTKDSTKVSKTSFLMRSRYNPFPLNVALASLRGARTIEQLKAATETDYPDGDYYKIVRRVLGESASEIIGEK